ncbi:MAG: STAS domain-containing protein [Xanthomonadaceae bacterium]|nr:STAS domain-containing protein [Xanthomonadaceae bacterium]MDE1884580.1 STAS domain-containing protein [Xanthomonadaceae bacterium]MDE1960902.1 STAS domain-containing protein [Xanthomonadaceae bacterium]MDE2258461.1 STAS domain-containing protein [Xanthomonadaceae bacterium]
MNAMENTCVSEDLGGYVLVRVCGEVDLSWSQQVRDAILVALGRGGVGVELALVTYIDSSGIAALVEGFQNARGKGKRFALIAASKSVLAVLQLARLDKVFPLFADVEAARAA